ncbi:MAG TPA: hypothetical protein DCS50_03140 [Acidaminococcaceae bacterium]|nr:hypothetical protein [Acidaminococcaceae bacterium]
MDAYTQYLIICPLLFLGGFVDSIAGGGGLITLPAYLLAGLPPHLALGTNKFSSAMGTTISTARLALNGFIKLRPALICIAGAFIGSSIGSRLALLISDEIFNKLLIIVLPIAAFYVMRNKGLSQDPESYVDKTDSRTPLRIAVIAFFIGGYDGFYGPGAGTFLLLALTGWAALDVRNAAGLTKAANLTSNIAALITFILSGNVDYQLGLAGAVCNIAGAYIGAGMVLTKANKIVKPLIIVVLALLFIKIITK